MTLTSERIVYAFPHAGANASLYQNWVDQIGNNSRLVLKPVELPGRGTCIREQAIHNLSSLAERLAADIHSDWQALQGGAQRDWVTFGHSFGGVLSVVVSNILAKQYDMRPTFSLVSCSVPPCCQSMDARHEWSDTRILQQVRRDGATPAAILNEPTMARQILSQMRADYTIRHQFLAYNKLTVHQPFRLIAATGDEHVPVEVVEGWKHHTQSTTELTRIEGDHFAVYKNFSLVCRELIRDVCQNTVF